MVRRLSVAASVLTMWLTLPAGAIDLLDSIDSNKWDKAKLLREAEDPAIYTNFVNEIRIAKDYPRTWSGTVYLDGKPAPGIRVTDGMGFVTTGTNGGYTITIQPDAMQPYLPNRNLSVCWPDNTFPEKDPKTGDLLWWRCVADFKDTPDKVDFRLVTRTYTPPLVIAFGTDPHDSLSGPGNRIWGDEIRQGSNRVDFAILGGDLTYADFKSADACFGHMRQFTREFPLPLIHVQGNHDFTSPLFGPHPNAGYGPFTRYLGPIRWSFDAGGVHIASMNYWLANSDSARWLDEDLKLAGDKPAYLFVHSWGSQHDKICQDHPNVRLVQGGHSHTTLPSGMAGNAEFWCYASYYRLVYIEGAYFDFVERDVAVNPLYRYSSQTWKPGGGSTVVSNVVVKNKAVKLKCPAASNHFDVAFSVAGKEAKARRWGLRLTNKDKQSLSFHYDAASQTLHMAGRETYLVLDPVPGYGESKLAPPIGPDGVLNFRITIHPDRVHCTVNGKISHIRFVAFGTPARAEIFAEGGAATFRSAEIWGKGSPVVDWNGYRRDPRPLK